MSQAVSQREESFKEAIGFDRVPLPEKRDEGVAAEWGDPRTIAGWNTAEWSIVGSTLTPTEEGAERDWTLKRGGETVTVAIFVSTAGPEAARRYLLKRATETMMAEIPYRLMPRKLGELSVTSGPKGNEDFIWFYHNASFYVRAMQANVDLLGMADALQKYAEKNLVARVLDRAPKIVEVDVPSETIVGDNFYARVLMDSRAEANRYTVDFKTQDETAKIDNVEGLRVFLDAVHPGVARIRALVIDRITLLSTAKDVEVRIQPAGTERQ